MKLSKRNFYIVIASAIAVAAVILGIILAVTLTEDKGKAVTDGDFVYFIKDRGAAIKEYKGDAETLELPSEIKGASVTSIDDKVFKEKSVRVLTLPATLEYIGAEAFADCAKLASVTINGNPSMGKGVFSGCGALKDITLSDALQSLGDYCFEGAAMESIDLKNVAIFGEGCFKDCGKLKSANLNGATIVPDRCFQNCNDLAEITLSDEVTIIGDYAFEKCYDLVAGYGEKPFVLPAKLQKIGVSAFATCSGVRSFDLPSSVTEIGGGAFTNCYYGFELKTENNQNFVHIDNKYITDKAQTRLICATSTSYSEGKIDLNVLPSTVTAIEQNCFGSVTGKLVIVKDTIRRIGDRAFAALYGNDVRVEIPAADMELGTEVFKKDTVVASYAGGSIENYVKSMPNLRWELLPRV